MICSLLQLAMSGLLREDEEEMDANVELSEEAFEEQFGETPITDPVELERHRQRLAEVEADVKEVNKEYMEGKKEWFERIDEFSDLPEGEFDAERTGALVPNDGLGRGALVPEVDSEDLESERYFDSFRFGRSK